MSGESRQVLIVGGGVIGLACAYYLNKSGWRITVIDRGAIGKGASHGNCGLVCPSHVLPLAEPGAVRQALQSLFVRDAPFRVRPRFDPALWAWLWHFARRCNHPDMVQAGRAIQPLLESSLSLYHELMKAEPIRCEWETRGLLYVYRTREAMQAYEPTDQLLRETFHVEATRHDGDAVAELEPALKPGLAGGWYYAHDTHLRPDRLLASWRELLQARGVEFRENCPLQELVRDGRRTRAARTGQGELEAEAMVVATGAWTPLLARQLGCRVPIQPGKGYSMTMPRPAVCPSIPLLFPEHRVAVTPMQTGYRLGSIMEFAGYDDRIDPRRLALLTSGATHYLREPFCEPVLEQWTGWRPMTYDSIPIIDRSPVMENVFIAAGHNMLGLSMAPATGKLVAEMVSGTQPHLDPQPYSVRRFAKK
jgi:D-amino-acid dehydrogenase